MEKITRSVCLILILLFAWADLASAQPKPQPMGQKQETPILVGRLSHVEGEVVRYVPDEQDWVAIVQDAPFGLNDTLHSNEKGKAEIIMPNNTWVRAAGNTQVQLIHLEADLTELDVASGAARFYNKSSTTVIKATTPFGYVMAPPYSVFDLYVGDQSVEVISLKEKVSFVHTKGPVKYEIVAGAASILADQEQIAPGDGKVDGEWDGWNLQRDDLWRKRMLAQGDSVKCLPPSLSHDAYVLEENGAWEKIYYQGAYRRFWRPAHVANGWAPFTVGRWTSWYGENCWIPSEPFGYVTHHYGSWIFAHGFWYWAPPVVTIAVGPLPLPPPPPLLVIPFAWYPGRVVWIFSGIYVGWVPLAPFEPYHCHHRWGPHTVVVRHGHHVHSGVRLRDYAHAGRAVIVPKDRFYRGSDYSSVRLRDVSETDLTERYQAAPVLDDRMFDNYPDPKQRYDFTDGRIPEKPHQVVIDRIRDNQKSVRLEPGDGKSVQGRVAKTKQGKPREGIEIVPPKVPNRFVPPEKVRKPRDEMKFPEMEIKRQGGVKPAPIQLGSIEEPAFKPLKRESPAPGQRTPQGSQPRSRSPQTPKRTPQH